MRTSVDALRRAASVGALESDWIARVLGPLSPQEQIEAAVLALEIADELHALDYGQPRLGREAQLAVARAWLEGRLNDGQVLKRWRWLQDQDIPMSWMRAAVLRFILGEPLADAPHEAAAAALDEVHAPDALMRSWIAAVQRLRRGDGLPAIVPPTVGAPPDYDAVQDQLRPLARRHPVTVPVREELPPEDVRWTREDADVLARAVEDAGVRLPRNVAYRCALLAAEIVAPVYAERFPATKDGRHPFSVLVEEAKAGLRGELTNPQLADLLARITDAAGLGWDHASLQLDAPAPARQAAAAYFAAQSLADVVSGLYDRQRAQAQVPEASRPFVEAPLDRFVWAVQNAREAAIRGWGSTMSGFLSRWWAECRRRVPVRPSTLVRHTAEPIEWGTVGSGKIPVPTAREYHTAYQQRIHAARQQQEDYEAIRERLSWPTRHLPRSPLPEADPEWEAPQLPAVEPLLRRLPPETALRCAYLAVEMLVPWSHEWSGVTEKRGGEIFREELEHVRAFFTGHALLFRDSDIAWAVMQSERRDGRSGTPEDYAAAALVCLIVATSQFAREPRNPGIVVNTSAAVKAAASAAQQARLFANDQAFIDYWWSECRRRVAVRSPGTERLEWRTVGAPPPAGYEQLRQQLDAPRRLVFLPHEFPRAVPTQWGRYMQGFETLPLTNVNPNWPNKLHFVLARDLPRRKVPMALAVMLEFWDPTVTHLAWEAIPEFLPEYARTAEISRRTRASFERMASKEASAGASEYEYAWEADTWPELLHRATTLVRERAEGAVEPVLGDLRNVAGALAHYSAARPYNPAWGDATREAFGLLLTAWLRAAVEAQWSRSAWRIATVRRVADELRRAEQLLRGETAQRLEQARLQRRLGRPAPWESPLTPPLLPAYSPEAIIAARLAWSEGRPTGGRR